MDRQFTVKVRALNGLRLLAIAGSLICGSLVGNTASAQAASPTPKTSPVPPNMPACFEKGIAMATSSPGGLIDYCIQRSIPGSSLWYRHVDTGVGTETVSYTNLGINPDYTAFVSDSVRIKDIASGRILSNLRTYTTWSKFAATKRIRKFSGSQLTSDTTQDSTYRELPTPGVPSIHKTYNLATTTRTTNATMDYDGMAYVVITRAPANCKLNVRRIVAQLKLDTSSLKPKITDGGFTVNKVYNSCKAGDAIPVYPPTKTELGSSFDGIGSSFRVTVQDNIQ